MQMTKHQMDILNALGGQYVPMKDYKRTKLGDIEDYLINMAEELCKVSIPPQVPQEARCRKYTISIGGPLISVLCFMWYQTLGLGDETLMSVLTNSEFI